MKQIIQSRKGSFDDIDITPELANRPARPPGYEGESRALVELAGVMATDPHTILQKLADAALELCQADSSGISILENDCVPAIFRWYATAGRFSPFLGGTTPRDFSPCGVVLDRNTTQLMADPVRFYPYIAELSPYVAELLLIPFYRGDTAIGTIWVVAHTHQKRFDAEDKRLLLSLGKFASAAIKVLHSISEAQRAEAEITRLRKEESAANDRAVRLLQEHDQQKNDFLATLAHELRNPLAAISNAVILMCKSESKEHHDYSTETIKRQSSHLSRLVDDLLDISRINLGKIEIRREVIDATAILDSAAQTVTTLVDLRKHTLDMTIDRGNLWVDADPTRLEQIVVNLLNNAAKYSEDGGHMRLTAGREGSEIVIRVTDTGIGITPETLPEMFQLFNQADHAQSRSRGGLGIGLAIVKKLVDLHDGQITATSEGLGKGSEFTIRLPAAKPTGTPGAIGTDDAVGKTRILVVDDNVDTVKGMAILLNLAGHEVVTANNGPQAIEMARTYRPQCILLDLGLPGMSGYDVARGLREEEGCKDALIVAVSGYGQQEDRQRTKAAGFDHHLVKPISFEELFTLLRPRLQHSI